MAISDGASYADILGHESKAHGSIYFPAACYEVRFPETAVPAHWHSELELIHVIRGCLHLTVGMDVYVLNEGDGIFLNKDVLHAAESENPKEKTILHSVVFHPRVVGSIGDNVFWLKYVQPLTENAAYPVQMLDGTTDWQRQILAYIEEAWSAVAGEPDGYEILVRNALSCIVLQLHLHHKGQEPDDFLCGPVGKAARKRQFRNIERIKEMLVFIRGHYFETVTLDDIAAAGSVSRSECIRCFRNVLGETPIRYLNKYRMQVAAQFLRETNWRISEIGFRCGFSEMGYFASEFRKIYGMTPGEYRLSQSD